MAYTYDRRTVNVLRGRSGWELRIISRLAPTIDTSDPVESAALAVDSFKKKHADVWQMLMEENVHPEVAVDTMLRFRWKNAASEVSPEEAKGILLVQKDSGVRRAGGKNPYASRPFNNPANSFDITFLAPNSRGVMRAYTWTEGGSLTLQDKRPEPQTFASEAEAHETIRTKVLAEIRRYHPGDDVFILGW